MIKPLCRPSATSSSAAFTVTTCGVAQSIGVNVSTGGTTSTWLSGVPSVICTSAAGCDISTTVYVSPKTMSASLTWVEPSDSVISTPCVAEVICTV